MLQEALLVCASASHVTKTVRCLSLKAPVSTNIYASNSVLLSLAAHMTFNFPLLDISNYAEKCAKIKA
jgi:hypothetical protein